MIDPPTNRGARDDPLAGADEARRLARGVARWLRDLGYNSLAEFRLGNGRRADILGLDRKGRFVIVEIKTSEADLRADAKWPEYLDFCDVFYFAVPEGFPHERLPDGHGIIVADAFGGAVIRQPTGQKMNAARRAAQTRRFAFAASARLRAFLDPRR